MDQKGTQPDDSPGQAGRVRVFGDFIWIAIPMLLLLIIAFSSLHFLDHRMSSNLLDVRESSYIKIGHETIRNDVKAATSDLMHLADSSHMQDFLTSGARAARENLANEFHSLLRAKKNYDQIRFIDASGMEAVRVNYNSGMPITVPPDKLQDKRRRYYFTDTFKLDKHAVFVSPMDLNIEKGRIEQPHKPVLRFGTPVFDRLGRKKGVVLINYFADTIRNNIANFLTGSDSIPLLLNAQGFWLMAPDAHDEWGFMYGNQSRFDHRYPEVWERIVQEKQGQAKTADGLFTFVTIFPLLKEHISSSGATDAYAQSAAMMDDHGYFWVLLTHIPQAKLNADVADHVKQGALQVALVALIVMPLVWLFSRERVGRRWAKRELQKKEQYLHTVMSQLAEGLLVIDRQGRLITMNAEAEKLLGWREEELIGHNLNKVLTSFVADKSKAGKDCVVHGTINDGVSGRMQNISFTTKQGGLLPASFSVAPFQYDDTIQGAIITFHDISERLQMLADLKIMATHDPLTGVKNRAEIERLLHREVDRARRYQRPLVVLMIDIDHFKRVNDTYGHQNGDRVLQVACESMGTALRSCDMFGRFGGEEFLAVLPETGLSSAQNIADRLRHCIADLAVGLDFHSDIRITVSIGAAAYPESADSAEKLVQIADQLLYEAKDKGRDQVVVPSNINPTSISMVASGNTR